MLIVFEGIDKSGKTTQAKLLHQKISPSVYISFPTRKGPIGSVLDDYLKNKITLTKEAAHLLFSADRWEIKNQIETDLKCGKFVIVDRYIYSGLAYSLTNGLQRGWCEMADTGLPKPDIVFFLFSTKVENGDERYEKKNFQKRLIEEYLQLSTTYSNWIILEEDDVDKTHAKIMEYVEKFFLH